jgi:hypothetical protein
VTGLRIGDAEALGSVTGEKVTYVIDISTFYFE